MSFEDSIKSKTISSGKNDPAATDLDYYSKPENYTGSNLQSLQRFKADKTKEEKLKAGGEKKTIVKDAKYYFFNRYKHLLQDAIFLQDLLDREKEETSEEEEEEEKVVFDIGVSGTSQDTSRPTTANLQTITEEADDSDTKSDQKYRLSADNFDQSTSFHRDDATQSPDSGVSGFHTPGSGSGKRKNTSAGRQSTALQRLQMDKVSKEIRCKELKVKFIKAVKGVKAIVRLSASARGKSSGDMSSMRTFMDIADEGASTNENMKNAGLSFDPSYFKAKKEISLSSETKNILTTPSEQRTPEQVQTAMFGLQCLRSFAEYPLHMQEKLAKVAWYEVVAPKRIIIRQGHFAENFYFILSGHAVVTILLRNPQTGASFVKTATVMKKGMSFGELALLHHSKRTATVTSQDEVQLLSIGREDFFDIFMSSEGPDNMPEHIRFISNLDFMKDWPIEELIEHPEFCLLHFFKRNTTIVPNSNQSDWMYIVKSGSCQVLKKLKGVTAKSFISKPKVDDMWTDPKLKAIVFGGMSPPPSVPVLVEMPKVNTGLRGRGKTQKDDQTNEEETEPSEDGKTEGRVKFSKDTYSQNPDTGKPHFSTDSCFSKRKHYEPPAKCRPKKAEQPKEQTTSVKPGPVFVQVSTMKPRDIFGLESIEFDDDIQKSHTSVSLVSRGAECIMLSKAFYVKHANEAVKKRVREFVRPYPDEHVFQDNLQIKEDWVMYKRVILTDLTSQIRDKSSRFCS